MPPPDVTVELDRQLAICNACRYCEGFCAVFGAAQLRQMIDTPDAAYLSSLCHDCRMCYDACMFTPPHDYALNIPEVMAQARVETYARYARPAALAGAARSPLAGTLAVLVAAIAVVALGIVMRDGPAAFAAAHRGPGAFYAVVPYPAMVGAALALAGYGIVCIALGALRYARDIEAGTPFVTGASLARALHEALALTYLRGGGAGCYDESRGSSRRRAFHALVFWGFLADLAATTSAFVLQDFLHRQPPFPLLSVPVVLGTAGGLGLAIGAAGLIGVKRRSDPRPADGRMVALDYAFLFVLEILALTGLALLALRGTAAMPALLAVHLGSVAGAFALAPYGKFAHFVYRSIALVKNADEQRRAA
jgi:citrate/tricarballylate utilization protein